jgi:hypothetical protein
MAQIGVVAPRKKIFNGTADMQFRCLLGASDVAS